MHFKCVSAAGAPVYSVEGINNINNRGIKFKFYPSERGCVKTQPITSESTTETAYLPDSL